MRVDTFVFVHDQNIVLDFDNVRKFDDIENLRYVFLGDGPVDYISDRSDVLVARHLQHNIEHIKSFVAFTGWYLIWMNKLSNADYINLFEYDVVLSEDFVNEQRRLLEGVQLMSYVPLNVHDYWYIGDEGCSGLLLRSVNSRYGIDYRRIVDSMDVDETVGITSNQTFSNDRFNRFMSWFVPMIPDLQDDPMCGHMPERAVSIYCRTNGVDGVRIASGLLKHYRLDSHGTGRRLRDEVANQYESMIGLKTNKYEKIRVLIFGKGNFIESGNTLTNYLKSNGIDNVSMFTDSDLPTDFKEKHREILSHKRGYGYCVWKPFIILDQLKKLGPDDVLVYIDSTDLPKIEFFDYVLTHFIENDILLLSRGFSHDSWTRRDTFVLMGCDTERYHGKAQLEAGVIGLKNTEFNVDLVSEWLHYCTNIQILAEVPQLCGLPDHPTFCEHRYDQSVLTNLQIKYDIPVKNLSEDLMRYNHNQPKIY